MFPEIKNYTIVREIGAGGMAVVYEAVDTRLQRTVAIKVLHPHLCKEPTAADRFMREARSAAKIDHPHVVRIFEFNASEGLHYIVMEFVPGTNMEQVLKNRGAISHENAFAVMYQVAEALAQAHSLGIVHRDVKPANILLHHQGRAMLSDFGVAHHLPDPRLTSADAVAGTPSFMSPEQISGKTPGAAGDIYSWGVCLHVLVTGVLPYKTLTFPDILADIRRGEVHMDTRRLKDLPSWFEEILSRCCAADPGKRIRDAGELLEALEPVVGKTAPSIDMPSLTPGIPESALRPSPPAPSSTDIIPLSRASRTGRMIVFVSAAFLIGALAFTIIIMTYRPDIAPGRITRPDSVAHESLQEALPAPATAGPQEKRQLSSFPEDKERIEGSGSARKTARSATVQPVPVARKPDRPPADSGRLFIHCNPWALVLIDGREIGTTPLASPVALPAGRYEVKLVNDICEPLTDTVKVPAGEITRRRYTLKVLRR